MGIKDFNVPESVDARRLRRCLDSAFLYAWKSSGNGQKLEFNDRYSLHQFFDLMQRMGDEGYLLGAAIFAQRVDKGDTERAVRSHLLTRLARMLFDLDYPHHRRIIRESEVAHMGRFVNPLIERLPEMHIEWAEDMNADDPLRDQSRQPTAVIRGVFLSPCLDQRRTEKFWEMASASERFPRRIFSDPCRSEDGAIFSSYQQRAFALVFSYAPEPAVVRFVTHMREHAKTKWLKCFTEGTDTWDDYELPAEETERKNAFINIAGGIAEAGRRAKVTDLLGLAA